MPARMLGKRTIASYSPALFDVAPDILGALPLALVKRWLESEQTAEIAAALLAPFKVTGYSVCSDSVGLTTLTRRFGLIDILAIIERPKQIIHALGTAIGGLPAGIWSADNTQTFFPASVGAEALLSTLLTIQSAIDAQAEIRVGLGAHFGAFYRIGGGLYGFETDAIEWIAENRSEAGDILVSQALLDRLPADHAFEIERARIERTALGEMFRVYESAHSRASVATSFRAGPGRYPIPYSESFHADLVVYANRRQDVTLGAELRRKYVVQRSVVVVEREVSAGDEVEVDVFFDLAASVRMKDLGLGLLGRVGGIEAKLAGPVGIYVFAGAGDALAFAQAFRSALADDGIASRFGVDAGDVLVFDLPGGGRDLAGGPVNIASKLAQDLGQFGQIYLSEAAHQAAGAMGFQPMTCMLAGQETSLYVG